MKDILWVKLPAGTNRETHEALAEHFEKLKEDHNLNIIVTTGDMELHFFNRRVFIYPYWLLKLKMLFK